MGTACLGELSFNKHYNKNVGFTSSSSGKLRYCLFHGIFCFKTDIDECLLDLCDQTCSNTPSSYACGCLDGYDLFIADGTNGFFIPESETGTLHGDTYRLDHSCVRKFSGPTATNFGHTIYISCQAATSVVDIVL